MESSESQIPETLMPEVMELASQLHAASIQRETAGYSFTDLIQAGEAVDIPPEIVAEALQMVQHRQKTALAQQHQSAQRRNRRRWMLGGVAVTFLLWGSMIYNTLAQGLGDVEAAWAQVETQLQRRADLIPQLVQVTQASARHDQDIVAQLTESHRLYLSAQDPVQRRTATLEMDRAIAAFQSYALDNSELKASAAYRNLQYEIAGTENRIATERRRYNQSVQRFNREISSLPNSLVAKLLGFERQSFFQAETTASPQIDLQ